MATLQQIPTVPGTMVSFKNILVATDFSRYSDNAFEYAWFLAQQYGSKVYAAHVFPTYALATHAEMTEAKNKLAKLVLKLEKQKIASEAVMGEGPIVSFLQNFSVEKNIDLIVAGTHGSTGIERLVLGSVAEEIVRSADCPVLTVGPKVPRTKLSSIDFGRIMYATDFSPESANAVPYVISLAEKFKAFTYLVHVLPKGINSSKQEKEKMTSYFTKELQKLVPQDWDNWSKPLAIVEEGDAVKEIEALAKGREADLIVMGAKKASATASHFRAGLAYLLMAQAKCPVLTLHTR